MRRSESFWIAENSSTFQKWITWIILGGNFSCTDLKLFTTFNRKQPDPCLMNWGHYSEDHFMNCAVAYQLWEPTLFSLHCTEFEQPAHAPFLIVSSLIVRLKNSPLFPSLSQLGLPQQNTTASTEIYFLSSREAQDRDASMVCFRRKFSSACTATTFSMWP